MDTEYHTAAHIVTDVDVGRMDQGCCTRPLGADRKVPSCYPPGVLDLPIPHKVPVLVLENGFERFVDVSVDALEQGGHATGDYAANCFVMSGQT